MAEKCEDCKSWEERIFWTHFQSTHFTQFLRGSFHQKLVLPEKFTRHFKQKLPSTVTLKGPSGNIWEVALSTIDGSLFFNHGWQHFVNDHSLLENDFLVFKYNGASVFEVLVFDGQSLCEKAASYFVRKCGHTEHDGGSPAKRKLEENPAEVIQISTDCGHEVTPQKSPNNDIKPSSVVRPINSTTKKKKMRNGVCSIRPIRARCSLGTRELSPYVEQVELKPKVRPILHATAHRRSVSQQEKRKALVLAQGALREDGFIIVMKPTHVRSKYFLTIPSGWLTRHFSSENQVVILRINETTWNARFCYYRKADFGGISSGWRSFATDNNLVEHDVCVFHPADLAVKPVVFDVSIFHVLQEAHALTDGDLVSDSTATEVPSADDYMVV